MKILNHYKLDLHHTGSIYYEKEKTLIIANYEFYSSSFKQNKRIADFTKLKKIIQLEDCIQTYMPSQIIFINGLKLNMKHALENLTEFRKKYNDINFVHISSLKNAYLKDFENINITCDKQIIINDLLISYQKEENTKYFNLFPEDYLIKKNDTELKCFYETKNSLSLPSFAQLQNPKLLGSFNNNNVYVIDEEEVYQYH